MTNSPSAPALMANMDIAIAVKEAIQTTTKISTITAVLVHMIINTPRTVGMASADPMVKATTSINRRVRTTTKVNQAGTTNTQEPIALGFRSAQITATLMLAMAITTSASNPLEASWPLHSLAQQSAQGVVMMY